MTGISGSRARLSKNVSRIKQDTQASQPLKSVCGIMSLQPTAENHDPTFAMIEDFFNFCYRLFLHVALAQSPALFAFHCCNSAHEDTTSDKLYLSTGSSPKCPSQFLIS